MKNYVYPVFGSYEFQGTKLIKIIGNEKIAKHIVNTWLEWYNKRDKYKRAGSINEWYNDCPYPKLKSYDEVFYVKKQVCNTMEEFRGK